MNWLLKAALSYARRDWYVVPLHSIRNGHCTCGRQDCGSPGKHPRTLNGVYDATNDPAVIAGWWRIWPDANVGIATGAASGFIVLDVDPRHGGDDSLVDLECQHGLVPETPQSLTGGGGRHLLPDHPGRTVPNRVAIAPGLDVRGDGGLIVAPPSAHASGREYAWDIASHPDDVPPAAVPGWLLALFDKQHGGLRRDGSPLLVRDGQRNDTLFRLGCALRRFGVGGAALVDCVRGINREHCQPPLAEDEVRKIVASAARYAPGTIEAPRKIKMKVV